MLTNDLAIQFVVRREADAGQPFLEARVVGSFTDQVVTNTVTIFEVITAYNCWDVWEIDGQLYAEPNTRYYRQVFASAQRQDNYVNSDTARDMLQSVLDDVNFYTEVDMDPDRHPSEFEDTLRRINGY